MERFIDNLSKQLATAVSRRGMFAPVNARKFVNGAI
jgi:hypothetical protein